MGKNIFVGKALVVPMDQVMFIEVNKGGVGGDSITIVFHNTVSEYVDGNGRSWVNAGKMHGKESELFVKAWTEYILNKKPPEPPNRTYWYFFGIPIETKESKTALRRWENKRRLVEVLNG